MKNNISNRILNYVGCLFILISLLLNQYTLKVLFSEDGILEDSTKLTIWSFEVFLICLGLLILFSKSSRIRLLKLLNFVDLNRKQTILWGIFLLILYTAGKNISASIIYYVASNLTIRESLYFENDVTMKGTHWGSESYKIFLSKNRRLVKNPLKYDKLFFIIKNVSLTNSNFKKEYEILEILYNLSKKPNSFKKLTAIYIPQTLTSYWDMSCDSHMPSFIVPAITNIAMIQGLPLLDKETCYTHQFGYGFTEYYKRGKNAQINTMFKNELCLLAKEEGFKRVIEITKDSKGNIIKITHECMEDI